MIERAFGKTGYARAGFVAELGVAFLYTDLGIFQAERDATTQRSYEPCSLRRKPLTPIDAKPLSGAVLGRLRHDHTCEIRGVARRGEVESLTLHQ